MARSYFSACNMAAQALSPATAKTALQVVAPTNQRIAVQQITVAFDGTVNTSTPVKVQLFKQTTAGTVSSSSATVKNKDGDIGTAIQSTVQDGFTAEPTSTDLVWTAFVHPQTGVVVPMPRPGEIVVKGGGRLGVVCTAPQAVDVICTLECEE